MSDSRAENPCRILCVDDEPAIRDVVSLLLRREGFEVDTAADAEIALAKLAQDLRAYHVVITDNQMPRMSGAELAARLRTARFPGKIIMFSSSLTTHEIERLRRHVDAVVEKGRDPGSLVGEIRRVIGESRQ